MRFLLLLFTVMLGLPAFGQSIWRNFFTTNQNPIVEVVAGSNATVQATTVGPNLRRFTVNSTATGGTNSGTGQTNWPASSITNAPWQYGSEVLTNLASFNGGALTNVPFTIWTNYTSNPNDYTNLNGLAFGQGIYGMTSFWAYATAPGIGPIGIYYSGIDTNTVITTNGGAFAGTILDNSVTSLAPINNQLVTAQWVRSLFAGAGVSYYASTNVAIGLTNADVAGTYVFTYQTNTPVYDRRIYANPAAGSYIGAVAVTNRLLQLNAGVTVNAYIELTGIGSSTATVKPEIYYSFDGTNWLGDYDSSAQSIVRGVTNLYSWVVANPTVVSTNATGFYVQRRFKIVSAANNPTLTFHLGTNFQSHITLSGVSSGSGNAYLAANQTWTGVNTFDQPIVGNGNSLSNVTRSTQTFGGVFIPAFASGANRYLTPNGGNLDSATEGNQSIKFVSGGIITNLYVKTAPSLGSGTNFGFIIVTNGVNSSLLVSYSGNGAVQSQANTSTGIILPANSTISCLVTGDNTSINGNRVLWSFEKLNQ